MSHVSAPPGWGCRLIREAATYRDGVISILDRRRYPLDVVRVDCRSVEEAAAAIEQMVTQSAGPARVAAYAMCLAAREPAANGETRARHLADAATRLVDTRPTNDQIANVVNEIRAFASAAPGGGTWAAKAPPDGPAVASARDAPLRARACCRSRPAAAWS